MTSRIHRWFLALCMGLSQVAFAQTGPAWPAKPIRMVVGYPSGSSPDVQARLLAEPLSRGWGSRWWWKTSPVRVATLAPT